MSGRENAGPPAPEPTLPGRDASGAGRGRAGSGTPHAPRRAGDQSGDGRRTSPAGVPVMLRRAAVALAVGRYLSAMVTIPFIPWLLRDHLPTLVLLQPRREWLLLGGAQLRIGGEPAAWLLLAAYTPLMVLGVWAFFVVGRGYRTTLRRGSGPRWATRALPPAQLELWQGLLVRRGATIAVIGRLAAVPPTVLAAAAGVSDVRARRYLGADLLGAMLTFAVVVGAGYGLGTAWERAGVWLTGLGVALLVVLMVVAARWIRREARRSVAATSAGEASAADGDEPSAPDDGGPAADDG